MQKALNKDEISILIVGICASGKTSVVKRLQRLGLNAKVCAQEHSCVKSLWTKLKPDVLIFLDCNYETIKRRRNVQWGVKRIETQKERLKDALDNCDLYLKTDYLTLKETIDKIINYLQEKGYIEFKINSARGSGMKMPITLETIKEDPQITAYIKKSDKHLRTLEFTEHSFRHANLVAEVGKNILTELDYSERIAELAAIAGYLHDIGNVVNRNQHAYVSATLVSQLLTDMGMPYEEIATVIGAIGNHDEKSGEPVNPAAAALIISDKADVHWTRVRNDDYATFDIHDRVNYAAKESSIKVDKEEQIITLDLKIDTEISTVMEYFEIFLTRMVMCRRAAETLDCDFQLVINEVKLL